MGNFYEQLKKKKRELEKNEQAKKNKSQKENSLNSVGKKVNLNIQYEDKPTRAGERRKKPHSEQETTELHMGLDFGTSYTKVCFRDLNAEKTVFVKLNSNHEGFSPSMVYYTPEDERIHLEKAQYKSGYKEIIPIPYLKMMLAEMEQPITGTTTDESIDDVEAFAIYYLAHVINEARFAALCQNKNRFHKRKAKWTGLSLGIPVQYEGTSIEKVFEEVLYVADILSRIERDEIPNKKEEILKVLHRARSDSEYIRDKNQQFEKKKLNIYPEIVAAVHSFVMSQEARPDHYAYFDVGGGTLDGIVFQYENKDGERRVNVISGRVAPLGVDKLSYRLLRGAVNESNFSSVKHALFEDENNVDIPVSFSQHEVKQAIYTQVSQVIFPTKNKIGVERLRQANELSLFIGGGGAYYPWIKKAIHSTYSNNQHQRCNLPPYRNRALPKPKEFILQENAHHKDFIRYAIAYGLSFPPDEDLVIKGFPRDNPDIETKAEKSWTQDTYDGIAMNFYGEHN